MIWQTCGTFFHALALRGLDFLLSSCLRLWTLTLPAHGNMFKKKTRERKTHPSCDPVFHASLRRGELDTFFDCAILRSFLPFAAANIFVLLPFRVFQSRNASEIL